MTKILILGLSGSGKTALAQTIVRLLNEKTTAEVKWFNADSIRELFDDWDFSYEGRLRQAYRMASHADGASNNGRIAICDFICPTEKFRLAFHEALPSNLIIWMDRTSSSEFKDTDALFEKPADYDYRICDDDIEEWADTIVNNILNRTKPPRFDTRLPTVQIFGALQPWHDGNTAAFELALEKTGQVAIGIRDSLGRDGESSFGLDDIERTIHSALSRRHAGQYIVFPVPNIVEIAPNLEFPTRGVIATTTSTKESGAPSSTGP